MNNLTRAKIKKLIKVVTYRLHILDFYSVLFSFLKSSKYGLIRGK